MIYTYLLQAGVNQVFVKMVQINLLPETARKKQKKKIELKVVFGPIIFVLSALILTIITVWAMLAMQLSAKQKRLTKLDSELKDLKFNLQKQEQLEKDKQNLLGKLKFMERQLARDLLWAENLNRLSNLIPPEIWLKNIILHTKKVNQTNINTRLEIQGSTVSLQSEEMIASIGGFMSALKKDPVFSKQFSEIKLLSSQRSKNADVEVMDFKLSATFAEAE